MSSDSLVIIQARLGSSRLPEKMIQPVGNIPLIERVLEASLRSNSTHVIVTIPFSDKGSILANKITNFVSTNDRTAHISYGLENDLINRFSNALSLYFDLVGSLSLPKWIVRVCGDRPLLDWRAINELIASDNSLNYVMNHLDESGRANGIGAEAISGSYWNECIKGKYFDPEHLTLSLQKKFLSSLNNHILNYTPTIKHNLVKKDIDTHDDLTSINRYLS
jgi:spore coat polysaccharide biosynthesis protein SpsF (cytidylyltransferase family)